MDQMPLSTRIRLSAMMFLQYMMFAVWFPILAAYLMNQHVDLTFSAIILSSMPLGCLVSPIFCMIADRHFSSEKVLIVLNFLCAILFLMAAQTANPVMLFVYLLLAMFCYMPTWSLTNAIAMSNSPSEKFPQIRVFGSIGWVAAGLFSIIFSMKMFGARKIDGTNIPLLCGAGTALVAAIVNFTLPNTPPPAKGQKSSIVDALGLRALGLMKDKNFALFIIISMLAMIPFTLYWSFGSQFLQDQGFERILVTMNWGQFVEMFVMLMVPIILAKFGAKWTMVAGLIALTIRYASFWSGSQYDSTMFYYIAILIHGVIFGFFFVGGQVYTDKKAPAAIKAQAQGLIVLICFGIGMLAGNFINGELIKKYSAVSEPVAEFKIPNELVADTDIIPGSRITDIKIFNRSLTDGEVSVLHAKDILKNDFLTVQLTKKAGSVDLNSDLLYFGDSFSGLTTKIIGQQALTFSGSVYLPKDNSDDPAISGTLFKVGQDDNLLIIGVREDKIYLQAGDAVINRRVTTPRGKDDDGNEKKIHITATFDGSKIKLFTDGNLYIRVNWKPIWKITTISCIALAILLALLFKDDSNSAVTAEPIPGPGEGAAEAVAQESAE